MAKRKKTIIAGPIVKTIIYTAPEPQDGKRARAEKSRMTSAAQKAMNDKTARGRLEMLLAANFTGRDLFITLTYRDTDLPANRAAAVKNVRHFLKLFREHRKARGQELKYIYTTEEKHGEARLHHHLVVSSNGEDIEIIRSLWPFGDIVDLEYVGKFGYETLAEYVTKESVTGRPVGAQMWTASRNMKKPIVKTAYVPNDTMLAVPVGCHIIEREEKVTEFGNYCYIKYRLPRGYKEPPGWVTAGEKGRLEAFLLT
ncbi:hypothetical protein [uncultured Dysosmobacter sp.]|uniref:rolling circle replication-associated protein n=1 Tax=uncultured Dysosmobacter sp. TaxID=2591384 RepID=UPI00262F596C|nr:hypothetical protein [uncultured Dysosmobacter sp.]